LIESMPLWLPVAFFIIALLYAAAGFGGGSAYLAVLAVSGMAYQSVPQTALLCNVVVTVGGVWHFHRGGHLDLKRVLPFFALSVPAAYVGGRVELGRDLFNVLLGVSLVAAGIHMMLPRTAAQRRELTTAQEWLIGAPVGAALGFVSGVVGIGGGVFLAPILLLAGWTTPKQTAAATSMFILVNSVAGLAGHLVKAVYIGWMTIPLAVAALVGGQLGSRAGSYRLSSAGVRRLLAAVIIVVGLRLLWKAI
jgi:uncharacterized membrane protein YfcA